MSKIKQKKIQVTFASEHGSVEVAHEAVNPRVSWESWFTIEVQRGTLNRRDETGMLRIITKLTGEENPRSALLDLGDLRVAWAIYLGNVRPAEG